MLRGFPRNPICIGVATEYSSGGVEMFLCNIRETINVPIVIHFTEEKPSIFAIIPTAINRKDVPPKH